ncbi:hypothetical protein GGI12_005707, partial [Dipsacomyces acuminosporus]
DRWGKVLSDYKDVVVHNKEKGAARWTFDFFKEVANIVEGDSQFMDSAASGIAPNAASSSATASGPLSASDAGRLQNYSMSASGGGDAAFRVNPATPGNKQLIDDKPSFSANTAVFGTVEPPRPFSIHRMSEPNLKLPNIGHSPVRRGSSYHNHSQHQQHAHGHQGLYLRQMHGQPGGPERTHRFASASHIPPISAAPISAISHASYNHVHNRNFSPTKQKTYMQPQAFTPAPHSSSGTYASGANSSSDTKAPNSSSNSSKGMAQSPTALPGSSASLHSYQISRPLQKSFAPGGGDEGLLSPKSAESATRVDSPPHPPPLQHAASLPPILDSHGSPEQTCRYALDMLERQMQRIDAQQESIAQLKETTTAAIGRVEQMLQTYMREQQQQQQK